MGSASGEAGCDAAGEWRQDICKNKARRSGLFCKAGIEGKEDIIKKPANKKQVTLRSFLIL